MRFVTVLSLLTLRNVPHRPTSLDEGIKCKVVDRNWMLGVWSWDTAFVRECYTPVDVVRDWRKGMRTRDAKLSASTSIRGNVVNVAGKANDIYTKGWISNIW